MAWGGFGILGASPFRIADLRGNTPRPLFLLLQHLHGVCHLLPWPPAVAASLARRAASVFWVAASGPSDTCSWLCRPSEALTADSSFPAVSKREEGSLPLLVNVGCQGETGQAGEPWMSSLQRGRLCGSLFPQEL